MTRKICSAAAALLIIATSLAQATALRPSITFDKFNTNLAPLPVLGQLQPHHSDGTGRSWWSIEGTVDYQVFAKRLPRS